MNAFEFENVSFAYPNHNVFSHLNLRIAVGDFVAIVGGNGAGKSTLLKLCVGALTPDCGQIRIFGLPVAAYRDWSKIGYVPQNPLRDKSFPITVEEIVAMGRIAGLGIGRRMRKGDRDIVTRALRLVGVDNLRSQMIGNLSGGQQQRVMVARALAAEPETLILDEPTAGIDAAGTEGIYSLLKSVNKDLGITVLLVSHDLERVARYAGTIANLDEGLNYYGAADRFCRRQAYARTDAALEGEAVNHA